MDTDTRQAERENDESEKPGAYAEELGAYAEEVDAYAEKLGAYAEKLETAFEAEVKSIEAAIKAAKKAFRGSNLPMAEKLALKHEISNMEGHRDKLKLEYFERRASIRAEVEAMLDLYQKRATTYLTN